MVAQEHQFDMLDSGQAQFSTHKDQIDLLAEVTSSETIGLTSTAEVIPSRSDNTLGTLLNILEPQLSSSSRTLAPGSAPVLGETTNPEESDQKDKDEILFEIFFIFFQPFSASV
jgi:hypothetical protein